MNIPLTHTAIQWRGEISLQQTMLGVKAWRIDYRLKSLYSPLFLGAAASNAGIRIAFCTNSTSIMLKCEGAHQTVDLVIDGEFHSRYKNGEEVSVTGLDSVEKEIEIWLAQNGSAVYKCIVLDTDATLSSPVETGKRRWLTYGSSITQSNSAYGPTKSWPGIIARNNNFDLSNMGYGGQCHLDPMLGTQIRDREVDFLSMCLGINIHGAGSLSRRTFYPFITGMVRIVREKHPRIPLVLISPIFCPNREKGKNNQGFNLIGMRSEIKEAVNNLRSCGDNNIHYVSGLDIFGPENIKYLPDRLHPDADGNLVLAENFNKYVVKPYFI